MNNLLEDTNRLLAQILVTINAYHVATMTPEQAKIYNELLVKSGAIPFPKEN